LKRISKSAAKWKKWWLEVAAVSTEALKCSTVWSSLMKTMLYRRSDNGTALLVFKIRHVLNKMMLIVRNFVIKVVSLLK